MWGIPIWSPDGSHGRSAHIEDVSKTFFEPIASGARLGVAHSLGV
jgi:hypothetical protein